MTNLKLVQRSVSIDIDVFDGVQLKLSGAQALLTVMQMAFSNEGGKPSETVVVSALNGIGQILDQIDDCLDSGRVM